jgi:hypothetical protein
MKISKMLADSRDSSAKKLYKGFPDQFNRFILKPNLDARPTLLVTNAIRYYLASNR